MKNKMKTIVKILFAISLIITTLFIFHFSSNALYIPQQYETVIASGYNAPNIPGEEGEKWFNYNGTKLPYAVLGFNETFCVYPGIHMNQNQLYYVLYRVDLEGKTAKIYQKNTNKLYKETTNDANATLLAQLVMPDTGSAQGSYYSDKQYSIWYTFPTFSQANNLGVWTQRESSGNVGGAIERAQAYINALNSPKEAKVESKTDVDKLKVDDYELDGKQYYKVGPYKYNFTGSLSKVIVKDQSDKDVDYMIGTYVGNNLGLSNNISNIKSENDFYIIVPQDKYIESLNVRLETKVTYPDYKATFWLISPTPSGTGIDSQNLITLTYEKNEGSNEAQSPWIKKDLKTDAHIEKVNKDNTDFVLPNVSFKIKNVKSNKFISLKNAPEGLSSNKDGDNTYEVDYVDNENDAYIFITNSEGKIDIYDILIGTYKFLEIKNENYGYEENPDLDEVKFTSDKNAVYQIKNKQILVKLSGYVWLDMTYGKGSERNDLYKDNDYDSNDQLLNNIEVSLIDQTTSEIVKQTKTRPDEFADGHYLFEDVLIEKLKDYIIQFEYDGLVYTNVVEHIDKDNGSKASESKEDREEFNNKFGEVRHKEEEDPLANKGYTVGANGSDGIDQLNYTWGTGDLEHCSFLKEEDNYFPIKANTNNAGYIIWNNFKYGMEEIENINLGLYKRSQPDLALVKKVESIKLTINGYENLYIYANRAENQQIERDAKDLNVGVKFRNQFNVRYTQPIYHADAVREFGDKNKELQAYITYTIGVINQSTTLTNTVEQIIDYFDDRYEAVECIGKNYNNETGSVTENVDYTLSQYNDKYKKIIINSDLSINPGETSYIYATLKLSRKAIYDICNLNKSQDEANKELLDNIAEIYAYTTYQDQKLYAGIDQDSAPGNAIPEDIATYEDDTAVAPAIQLEFKDDDANRTINGRVFEDYATDEDNGSAGKLLLGNGIYDSNEPGIEGVEVQLQVYNSETGKWEIAKLDGNVDAITYTDQDGMFEFKGYTPDQYKIVYIWGDQKYKGTDPFYTKYSPYYFKSTITPKWKDYEKDNRYNWYLQEVDTRYNDAQDIKEKVEELAKVTDSEFVYENIEYYKENQPNFKMISETLSFKSGIEYGDDQENYTFTTISNDNSLVLQKYDVNNIDFGIIEKGKTKLSVTKRVESFKLTLSNGSVYAQGYIDDDDNITGDLNSTIFVPKTGSNNGNGQLTLQVDSELLANSILEAKYKYVVENQSSITYDTFDYYYYGTIGSDDEIVTISAGVLIDYLDDSWQFEKDLSGDNANWYIISKQDLIDKVLSGTTYHYISNEVADCAQIDSKIILLNESLADEYIKPLETRNAALIVQSKITKNTSVDFGNSVNVGQVNRPTSKTPNIPVPPPSDADIGTYIPGDPTPDEPRSSSKAEDIQIIPPTGSGKDIRSYIIVSIIALTIIGAGTFIILNVNKKRN